MGRIIDQVFRFGLIPLVAMWCGEISLNVSAADLANTASSGKPMKMVSEPAISTIGKNIAMAWAGDIWIADASGDNLIRATSHPSNDRSPEFSPDGKQLAFVSSRTGAPQIYLLPLQSDDEQTITGVGRPQQITHHTEGFELHGWFPDGQHVIATGNRDHGWKYASRMLCVPIGQRSAEKILVDAIAAQPSVASDGNRILFVREGERWWRKGYVGEKAAQIWLYEIDTKKFTQLLHEGVDCRHPLWDGDREAFFFTRGDYKGASLCWFDLESGKHTEIANFEDDSIVFPSINVSGTKLVFRHLFDLYQVELGNDRPLTNVQPKKIDVTYFGDSIEIDDEIRRKLTRADEITFSPDGLEMVFTSGGDLWAMDTKLKEPIRLSDTPGFESGPILTADSLITTSVRNGQTDIWQIQLEDQQAYWWQKSNLQWKRLTNDPMTELDARLSPDGKHVYFVRQPGDLMRMTVDGKEVTRIVDGFSKLEFDLSACGTWIAYASSDDDFNADIWITKADGSGEPYNVSKHPDNDGSPKFSPDGKILAFTGRRVDTETDIYYVYLQTDAAEETKRQRLIDEAIETIAKKRESKGSKKEDGESGDKEDECDKDIDNDENDEDKEEDNNEPENLENDDLIEPIQIDFKGLDERIKRLSINNSNEANLIWSPDSKKLIFDANIDGDSGMYSVTFPDELSPEKFADSSIRDAVWTKQSRGLLGLVSGKPAKINKSGEIESYDFAARQTYSRSAKFGEAFDQAWRVMRDRWYDQRLGGRNWNAVRRKYKDAATHAISSSAFGEIMQLMLGELNGSHNKFTVSLNEPSLPQPAFKDITAHLGVRFDMSHEGNGLLVADVLPDTPADRIDSKLLPGDLITRIDDTPVDPEMDLTTVLNGPLSRDIALSVKRAIKPNEKDARKDGAESLEIIVTMRPTTYATARSRLYDKWLADNRQIVAKRSKNRLGYLHIRSMDLSSFYEFEKQLYRVGYGHDGLVIDVRDNGGGFTTDRLLTALTQPRHAITVPRDGGTGYPQDRMVFAVWQKPIVVLCNQNSYSNAEIFSHAIRNLGRGKLVGVQTAGGVISTGSVRIMDVGTMRMPYRGWFTINDGEDMELKGAMPHHVIWPQPGEIPAGKDRQLNKAVKVLLKEVRKDAKENPKPKPKYETTRDSS